MGDRNPRQMTTGEVAKQARKAGIKDIEHMNKEQMLQAMGQQPQESRPGQGGGRGDRPAPAGSDPKQWKDVPGNQS
jgi:hypothetical protein